MTNREKVSLPGKFSLLWLGMFAQFSGVAFAQEVADPTVTETNTSVSSRIRGSQFLDSSPVVAFTGADVQNSGATDLGAYLRTLPSMENIDTVASIFSSQDGVQDSTADGFNLRGLGTNSTLILLDGQRTVQQSSVADILPAIALQSVEILTDGGSALYGSGAVAGVANLVSIKQYEGITGRVSHHRDESGSTEHNTAEFLLGHSFGSDLHWVAAFEYRHRTPLLVGERPGYLEYYRQDSRYGNPGEFRPDATLAGRYPDPSCSSFNDENASAGLPGGIPSGTRINPNNVFGDCLSYVGEWQDYARESDSYTLYNNLTFNAASWLQLDFQMSQNYRRSVMAGSPTDGLLQDRTTASVTNNLLLVIPPEHPANPFPEYVHPTMPNATIRWNPWLWRPFAKLGTLPSHLAGGGSSQTEHNFYTDSYSLGGRFALANTSWTGDVRLSYQQSRREYDGYGMRLSKMASALKGEGGVGGNEWFNPFGSADSRSPLYVAGVTDNSQALVDWLFDPVKYRDSKTRLKYLDVNFSGELLELPGGVVRAAVGGQLREEKNFEFLNPLTAQRDNLYVNVARDLQKIDDRTSAVRAVFAELEIPIAENIGVKAAIRDEDFHTLGLQTTTPKVALLWQPFDTLTMRASYSENFLAPSAAQRQPLGRILCETYEGVDSEHFGDVIYPATRDEFLYWKSPGTPGVCSSGNPDLGVEESETVNFGFSWEPIKDLHLAVDYQEQKYSQRIDRLTLTELTDRERLHFLSQAGLTEDQYDPVQGDAFFGIVVTADGQAAEAWARANPNPLIQRNSALRVVDYLRAPVNVYSQFVEGIDLKLDYAFDLAEWGTLSARLVSHYYTRWEYQENEFVAPVSALGQQNANSRWAPPIPRYRANLGLMWNRNNQAASVTFRHSASVAFDETRLTLGYEQSAPETIRAITRVDMNYSYVFDALGTDMVLTTGVLNLFDRQAQRLPQYGGLETRLDDPLGRQFHLALTFKMQD